MPPNTDPLPLTSKSGHTFVVLPPEHSPVRFPGDPLWCDTFEVTLDGHPAGKLFRSESYGRTADGEPRWHASISGLRNRLLKWGEDGPTPYMFDVAAFDTFEECFAAWARHADGLLAWHKTRTSEATR